MKKAVLLGFASFLLMSCAATKNTGSQNAQSDYAASTTVKVVGPEAPMVAPSNNKLATLAYNMGTKSLRENKLEEAEQYLKDAINSDSLFVDAIDHLGMVYRRQNRLDEAEEMYLKSIKINKNNKVPYQNLAVVYRLQNKLNEALELYKSMIQMDEDDPESYYGIGTILFDANDYEKSLIFFDKAMVLYYNQKSPHIYDAFYYIGIIYYEMDKYDDALKYLEEARKGNPNNKTIEKIIKEIKSK